MGDQSGIKRRITVLEQLNLDNCIFDNSALLNSEHVKRNKCVGSKEIMLTATEDKRAVEYIKFNTGISSVVVQGSDTTSEGGLASTASGRSYRRKYGLTSDLEPVIPLAAPKGQHLECEICHKAARCRCVYCHVTYYCSKEHYEADVFHGRMCGQYAFIRKRRNSVITDQLTREMSGGQVLILKRETLDELLEFGVEQYYKGNYETARTAVKHSLIFLPEVYGPYSTQLITVYTLIANVEIRLRRWDLAAHSLNSAEDILRRMPTKQQQKLEMTKAILFQSLALLNMGLSLYDDALFFSAEAVYYLSVTFGPDSTTASSAFLILGTLFSKLNRLSEAINMHEHCCNNWYAKLVDIFQDVTKEKFGKMSVLSSAYSSGHLSKIEDAECEEHMHKALKFFKCNVKEDDDKIGIVFVCLALLFFLRQNYSVAHQYAINVTIETAAKHFKTTAKQVKKFSLRALNPSQLSRTNFRSTYISIDEQEHRGTL